VLSVAQQAIIKKQIDPPEVNTDNDKKSKKKKRKKSKK